jgi:hypothetical protein
MLTPQDVGRPFARNAQASDAVPAVCVSQP